MAPGAAGAAKAGTQVSRHNIAIAPPYRVEKSGIQPQWNASIRAAWRCAVTLSIFHHDHVTQLGDFSMV
jgi:hypothetical protein